MLKVPQQGGNMVGSPQPPMDMPSMNDDMGDEDMGQMGDMNPQPPMNDMGDENMGNEFDTNFDAGVDANEETDPKKYIQQLTGKLSQSLRKYNSEQPQVDSELSKYVAGMIVKQAIEGLDEKDTADILKKIKSDEDFEMNDEEQMGNPNEQPSAEEPQEPQMPMESLNREYQIDEVFQDLTNTENDEENVSYKTNRPNYSFRKKPFTSPNFK